jgi:hypothetical protein
LCANTEPCPTDKLANGEREKARGSNYVALEKGTSLNMQKI